MFVHKQLTVSNLFCSVFPVITYIFKGNCVVVMHVQLQLCIIATCNSWLLYFITIIVTLIYVSTRACTLHVTFCCKEPFVYVLHPLCNQTESLYIA